MKQIVLTLSISVLMAACQGTSAPPSDPVQEFETIAPEETVPAIADNAESSDSSAIANGESATVSAPIKTATVKANPSLRIHESPGTNTPVIYAAPNGTALNIYAETAMGDSTWYQVKAQSGSYPQQLGWAYGGNLIVNAGGGTSEPNADNLAMSCSGSFSNGSGFIVNYTREAGFSRFTLDPDSAAPITVNLTYSGTTDAQHGVWKGTLSESEVRIDHISSQAPKPGDEVNVEYNIFSGRAGCR